MPRKKTATTRTQEQAPPWAASLRDDMSKDMQALRDDMSKDMQALRDDIVTTLRGEMSKDMQALRDDIVTTLRGEMSKDMQALRDDMNQKFSIMDDNFQFLKREIAEVRQDISALKLTDQQHTIALTHIRDDIKEMRSDRIETKEQLADHENRIVILETAS